MKITVPFSEVLKIVELELRARGVSVYPDSGNIESHVEGQYEEQQSIPDGISYTLDLPRHCKTCGYNGPCTTCPKCITLTEPR
jgi:hypothetical protein